MEEIILKDGQVEIKTIIDAKQYIDDKIYEIKVLQSDIKDKQDLLVSKIFELENLKEN